MVPTGKHIEIDRLLRERPLTFPIASKEDFIKQMALSGKQVDFRGVAYEISVERILS
jgi:hypothetical protein